MDRFFQVLLIGATLALSWLAMMAVHEAGHVLHLWCSGGTVERVELSPWSFSRTVPGANPRPLFVAWGGGIWGCVLPVVVYVMLRLVRWRFAYLARFFAGFCLVANGAYFGAGALLPGEADDAGVILALGSPRWTLLVFGVVAVALGLALWHRLGPQFGLGPDRRPVDRQATIGMAVALLVLVTLELLLAL